MLDKLGDRLYQEEELRCLKEYQKLVILERMFLQQRSKINWIKKEDEQNAYFYACVKNRRQKSHIGAVTDDTNQIVTDQEGIFKVLVKYYSDLMGTYKPVKLLNSHFFKGGMMVSDRQ